MTDHLSNVGRFPDGAAVFVPFPLPDDNLDRPETWPWLLGTVISQSEPNEWHIRIQDQRAGVPIVDCETPCRCCGGTSWIALPTCLRDSSTIYLVPDPGWLLGSFGGRS